MGAAPSKRKSTRRSRTIGVTPDADLLQWLEERMGPGERWSGPTHFFNWALKRARAEEQGLRGALESDRRDTLLDLLRDHGRDESGKGKSE